MSCAALKLLTVAFPSQELAQLEAITTDATIASAAVPEWIELVPATDENGFLEIRDWRLGIYVDQAAIIEEFNSRPEERRRSPIDWQHAGWSWRNEKAPAAGWIRELEERAGAVWGRIEWTERGAKDIAKCQLCLHLPNPCSDRDRRR